MKAVIILTFLAIANAAPKPEPCFNNCRHGRTYPVVESVYHTEPVVHEHVYTSHALPAPTITEYTTHSVGPAEYHPVSTEVHTTSHNRYHVQVPVTYSYTIEQPVQHSTTVYRQPHNTVYSSGYSLPSTSWSSWNSFDNHAW